VDRAIEDDDKKRMEAASWVFDGQARGGGGWGAGARGVRLRWRGAGAT
jgi:hypothetical protein